MDWNVVEEHLLKTKESDKAALNEATKFIMELNQTENCIPIYLEILDQSMEMAAKMQASTMMHQFINANIDKMTEDSIEFLKTNLIVYLDQNPQAPQVIWNNISDVIILIVQKKQQFWPELDQFIDKLESEFSLHRLETLSKVISFLPNEVILAKYQAYGSFTTAAITASTDFDIISTGILILSSLIDTSKSASEFEACFAKIIEIITAILPTQELTPTQDNKFWNAVSFLISDLSPTELIAAIIQYLMIPELDSQRTVIIFDALGSVAQNFSLEQIVEILNQAIVKSIKHLEVYQELPIDILTIFDTVFDCFPHAQLYAFIKEKIGELAQDNIVIAILLLSPLVSNAYDKIANELDLLLEPLKVGFQSNNSIVIDACQDVIESINDDSPFIGTCQEVLFPLIVPFLVCEDRDIRVSLYESLQALFDSTFHKAISNDYLTTLLEMKGNVIETDHAEYLRLVAEITHSSENISDAQVHEILELLVPLLDIAHEPNLSSIALFVLGQLVSNGEFAEIEPIIPNTVDAVKYNLKSTNDDDVVYTLIYLLQLTDAYGENVAQMLHGLWKLIKKRISKHNRSRVMEYALKLSCEIAILSEDQSIVPVLLPILESQFEKEHYEVFITVSSRIVRLLDQNQYQALLVRLIDIFINCDYCDIVASCCCALYKFLKYSPEAVREDTLQKINQIIEMFFQGSINCLEMRSIIDPETDINLELLTSFAKMANKFVSIPSPYVEPVCQVFLQLGSRESSEYKNVVISLFIDAIENGTVPPTVAMDLLQSFETFMSTNDEGLQQNIVYLMILFLRNFPDSIQSISKYMDMITQWWAAYSSNPIQYGDVLSNIASFLLLLASITMMENFPPGVLEQAITMFPPTDLSETDGMCQCLLKLFSGIHDHPGLDAALTPEFRIKSAIGIAKLLSEPAKKKRKMNLSEGVVDNMTILLRTLCQSPEISQNVVQSLEGNAKRKAIVLEILQS